MATKQNKKLTVSLYTPHAGQMLLHDCPARFRVMSCGRRFGKTLAATNELAKKALEKPSSLNWWVAPTYRQTEIAFNLLAEALTPVMTKDPNKGKMRIELINGSIIECRSAERYENMRGDGPSFVVFDEASKCPKEAWTEVVRPALSDNQGGGIFISTPWGHDWFWELFMRGQDPNEPDYWSHSFPTWANPFIPAKEIDEARRTLPEFVFQQEFEAIFLDDAASVFRKIDQCVAGEFKDPVPGHYYVVGWDVAKQDDYSVITVIDCNTGEVVYFSRFNRVDYSLQLDNYVVPTVRRYNDAHVVMDSTGVGNPILEEAVKRDISVEGYYFTNASKKELIDRTVVAIENRYITYPAISILLSELKVFSYEITKSRNVIYSAPEGKHDDCVISLCLAVWGAKRGSTIPMAITKRDVQEALAMIPQQHKVDDAWIMLRQQQMARNLGWLQSSAPYVAPESSEKNDNTWGVA